MANSKRGGKMKASPKAKVIASGYIDKRSRPGLYYGTDGLIKQKDGTYIEDPKTFKPVRKA